MEAAGPGDENDTEVGAHHLRIGKVPDELRGSGIGADIKIFGHESEQLIAHAAADEDGPVSETLKCANDIYR